MNPKAARTETYAHLHKGENCPCADTSGTVVATRRVPGFQVVENHYPAGLELSSHRHGHAYLSYVLAGPYAETYGNSNTVICAPRVLRYLPPEQTHAENFYFVKQMQSRTPVAVVLNDGEVLRGTVEWYDRDCIKLTRFGSPNLLVYKHCIKYLYKEGEDAAQGGTNGQ